ncbi:MAG TPA: hypothetical protein PKE00_02970 [Planctomycetota bacterium]|nr:hypothetical protein [Planctomycetota bacterium]
MKTLVISTACCLLAASISAQTTTAELRAATQFGNFARDGAAINLHTRPADYLFAQTERVSAAQGRVKSSSYLTWSVSPTGVVSVGMSEEGSAGASTGLVIGGTTTSTSTANLPPGPHEVRLSLRGAPSLAGKIEVEASGVARSISILSLAVDVGDDQSTDFSLTVPSTELVTMRSQQWPVRFDANGRFAVRIITDARAIATTTFEYWARITMRFTPGSFCAIEPYGQSCGPWLLGNDTVSGASRLVSLQVRGALGNPPGMLIFGATRLALPLPGTQCFLNTNMIVGLPIQAPYNGSGQWNFWTPVNRRFIVNSQALFIAPNGSLTSTNAIQIVCP